MCIRDSKRESRQLKSGKYLFTFALTDYTGSVSSKIFLEEKDLENVAGKIKEGQWLRVGGDCQYDSYAHEVVLRATGIRPVSPVERTDNAPEKRVELHLHTQMSSMDGLCLLYTSPEGSPADRSFHRATGLRLRSAPDPAARATAPASSTAGAQD